MYYADRCPFIRYKYVSLARTKPLFMRSCIKVRIIDTSGYTYGRQFVELAATSVAYDISSTARITDVRQFTIALVLV